MAAKLGIAPSTAHRIWKAHGLKPHLVETFKLSRDPDFVDKVEDVVGLYLDPPDKALVLSVDEKSRINAHRPPCHIAGLPPLTPPFPPHSPMSSLLPPHHCALTITMRVEGDIVSHDANSRYSRCAARAAVG